MGIILVQIYAVSALDTSLLMSIMAFIYDLIVFEVSTHLRVTNQQNIENFLSLTNIGKRQIYFLSKNNGKE